MTAWLDDGDVQLYHGSALEVLRSLPAGAVQTCVTSPPYWGLRDYGTGSWTGGDAECDHVERMARQDAERPQREGWERVNPIATPAIHFRDVCGRCGARRVDAQLGLERTPTEYVAALVAVFAEVWRVLRDDGTLWLNLGDSYAGSWGNQGRKPERGTQRPINGEMLTPVHDGRYPSQASNTGAVPDGLKAKDLCGVPWRVAFALQEAGWYLRSDIIWSKPNPMPESVTDRPTKAHEQVFLLSKQPRYFFDQDAVREPHSPDGRTNTSVVGGDGSIQHRDGERWPNSGRNMRSVWEIATQPTPEAHFATFPEALVRRCILAGSSEAGGCAKCGAPWQRVVERGESSWERRKADGDPIRYGIDGNAAPLRRSLSDAGDRAAGGFGVPAERIDRGWAPSCACGAPVAPQTVLDPFVGSGTTALVARKLGRRAVVIDLSADYLAIAARRLGQQSLFATNGQEVAEWHVTQN